MFIILQTLLGKQPLILLLANEALNTGEHGKIKHHYCVHGLKSHKYGGAATTKKHQICAVVQATN